MKHHLILRVIAKFIIPLIILFSLYVQFHGDYGPGGGFQAGLSLAAFKLLLIFAFLLFTNPTASHALGNAALQSGLKPRLADDSPVQADD